MTAGPRCMLRFSTALLTPLPRNGLHSPQRGLEVCEVRLVCMPKSAAAWLDKATHVQLPFCTFCRTPNIATGTSTGQQSAQSMGSASTAIYSNPHGTAAYKIRTNWNKQNCTVQGLVARTLTCRRRAAPRPHGCQWRCRMAPLHGTSPCASSLRTPPWGCLARVPQRCLSCKIHGNAVP